LSCSSNDRNSSTIKLAKIHAYLREHAGLHEFCFRVSEQKRGVAGEYWKLHTAEEIEENRRNTLAKQPWRRQQRAEALSRSMLNGIMLVATASAANENDNR